MSPRGGAMLSRGRRSTVRMPIRACGRRSPKNGLVLLTLQTRNERVTMLQWFHANDFDFHGFGWTICFRMFWNCIIARNDNDKTTHTYPT